MKSGWRTKKLGDICDIERGGSPRPIDNFLTDAPDGINWIKIGDTKNVTKYITSTAEKIRPEGAKRSRLVYEGDFILSNSMSFGRPYIMKTTGCIHDGWLVLRQPKVDQDYLYYVLGSDLVFVQFDRLASGSTVRNLNIGLVKGVQIPVPSLPEQQRIVGILDAAFDGIATTKANAEKNLQNARALFENHLQSVFTQRGDGWVEKKLGECVKDISTGPFGSLLHKSDYEHGGIPLVNPINIEGDEIIPDDRKAVGKSTAQRLARYALRENDIVIARRGEIGRCAVVARNQAGWLCGTGCFVIRPSDNTDPHFMTHLLRSRPYRGRLEGVSERATMPSISNDDLANLIIRLPPVPKQRRTLELLDSLSTETQRLATLYVRKLAALEALKKSLLHQAFRGQL